MYKLNYTQQSFEEVIQQAYDALEADDIKNLLFEVHDTLKKDENDFIRSVFNVVYKSKNISFRQWKALSAYVATYKKKTENKTF
jgi:hypothetical protein